MSVNDTIKQFIEDEILNNEIGLSFDTELFTSNLLDSVALVSLIGFLDDEFKIKVKSEDIKIENVNTIESLSKLVQRGQ